MKLLDLFCGAGGAAMGYHRAGFEVVGVDIKPQPHYPFEFHQADAMSILHGMLDYPTFNGEMWRPGYFDAIHASPPCQGYSRMRHLPWLKDREYPLLIDPVRELLQTIGLPWVIENVEDAPLARSATLFGGHGVLLCGSMFGLPVYRHRPFESNVVMEQPVHRGHTEVIRPGRMFGDRGRLPIRRGIGAGQQDGGVAGHMGNLERVRAAMGIEWMTGDELSQAIPPAYTEFIGDQLRNYAFVHPAEQP